MLAKTNLSFLVRWDNISCKTSFQNYRKYLICKINLIHQCCNYNGGDFEFESAYYYTNANAKSCFRESVVIYVTIQVTTSKYNDNFR